jgi:hypothetical protein
MGWVEPEQISKTLASLERCLNGLTIPAGAGRPS